MRIAALLGIVAFSLPVSGLKAAPATFATYFAESHTKTSVEVVRIADGKTLYALNPEQTLCPASVTKLVTAAAALAKFDAAHTFKTHFYSDGKQHGSRVSGDLIVVGDGDPMLVSEKLWQLAADVRHLGITEFTGDLVIDNSLFGDESRDISRKDGVNRSSHAYDAPVTALGVNFNTLAVAIAPGERPGSPALVTLDPYPLRGVSLQNHVRTVAEGQRTSVNVTRLGAESRMVLSATGVIARDAPMQKVYRSVGDPVVTSGEQLQAFLAAAGVTVRGRVRAGKKPASARPLLDLESYEMRRLVSGLNTYSNNFIADMLVKRLGAAFPPDGGSDLPGEGTMEHGVDVLQRFLTDTVGVRSAYVLKNGSGLNTDNRLSARQVTTLLTYMARHMDLFPEYLASLPASGLVGTLRDRFGKDLAVRGQIRAKTGTLTEPITVSSIAGYFQHPKYGLVAFAILENGQPGSAQPALAELRNRQDRVLVAFLNKL